ncbi:MAG: GntR family transcriptional regulator [Betaproteobacteria bacterium]
MLNASTPSRRRKPGASRRTRRIDTRPAPPSRPEAAQRIYENIVRAVEEHRLPPGTKLGEQTIAALFGVSRARVRQALHHLSLTHIVTLHPNRGAFVAEPSIREARAVFAARRLVEPPLAASLVGRLGSAELQSLRRHVGAEEAARSAQDRRESIRLSGEFHVILAELSANTVVTDIVRGLVARSSLIIALYQRAGSADCAPDEHGELVDALGGRPARVIVRIMDHHLRHVEASLRLAAPAHAEVDLRAVLGADAR